MENSRLSLHQALTSITPNVYYQPPETLKMKYPCIVYALEAMPTKFADNGKYKVNRKYGLVVLDRDPESPIIERVLELPMTSMGRPYSADNIWHTPITIFI